MNPKQIERYMRDNGFRVVRQTRHGTLWTNGARQVLEGREHAGRNMQNFMAEVKRAISSNVSGETEMGMKLRAAIEDSKRISEEKLMMDREKGEEMKPQIVKNGHDKKTQYSIVTPSEPTPRVFIRRSYDQVTQHKIWSRIEELWKQGKTTMGITLTLESEGFKAAGSDEPIAKLYVQGALAQLSKKGRLKLFGNSTGRNPYVDPEPAHLVRPQQEIAVPEAVQAVAPKVDAVKRVMPDSLINAATDPQVNDSEFRAIFRALARI